MAASRAPEATTDAASAISHYCAHCLEPAEMSHRQCTGCGAPFTGAGRHDLLSGPPPSGEFRFLFSR